MKVVSLQSLKKDLSQLIREAERGERVVIERHGRPVASLGAAGLEHTHIGARFGKAALRPLLRRGTRGAYLRTLLEDRRDDSDGR